MENGRGCSQEQRIWVRRRDSDDMQHPDDCRCQFHAYTESGRFRQCDIKLSSGKVEIHHLYSQAEQKRKPMRYGGENPYNLVALCGGERGKIGHHDLMSPQLIIAKMKYQYDRNSFEDTLDLIRQVENAGIGMHDHQYDGMLKQIARVRTDMYMKKYPNDKFPKHKYDDGESSLPNNGTIFDGGWSK